MATFVEITPDAFNEKFHALGNDVASERSYRQKGWVGGRGTEHNVRRPVRGIQIKDDTYAMIQVRTAGGVNLPLFDAAGTMFGADGAASHIGRSTHNSNFLIQQVQEQRAEKQQIVLTFGEPYIFFFGEQPRIINVTGVLLNTEDFNWRAEWWENYDRYLRGTQCVRQRTRVYLSWDDIVVEGYIMSANAQEDATNRNIVQFQFQMFLTNYENISNIGDAFGHIKDKEISLNPDQIEFLNSLGQGSSTTLAVREGNQPTVGNSLLQNLRNGAILSAFAQGTARLVEIQDQVVDILAEAGRFVSGRNIRVPVGFTGSGVFDDAQIALASLSFPTSESRFGQVGGIRQVEDPNNPGSISVRSISISQQLAGHTYTIQGELGARFGVDRRSLGLYENEDEFVARYTPALTGKTEVPELYRDQKANGAMVSGTVRRTFKEFGIDLEETNELNRLIAKGVFGVVSIAAGVGLNAANDASSGGVGFGTNILGTVL
jgi:hypothetical protein